MSALSDVTEVLLARRRSQKGFPTLGDEADAAFLGTLAALPEHARDAARDAGERLGRDVYSRRFYEDTLPGAVVTLSTALLASGVGSLQLTRAFHRTAELAFHPASALAKAEPAVARAFLEGTLAGFFSAAFNCAALAQSSGDAFHVELGAGRDINGTQHKRGAA